MHPKSAKAPFRLQFDPIPSLSRAFKLEILGFSPSIIPTVIPQ
jgi:hypothetical protein